MAGESKAKVIPLHSNSGRTSAQRRAAAARAESSRRHPSLLSDPGRRASAEQIAAVVREIDQRRGAVTGAEDRPSEAAKRIGAIAEFVRKRMIGDYTVDEFGFDSHLNNAIVLPLLRVLFQVVVPGRGQRDREPADDRRGAGGRQPRRRAAVRRTDDRRWRCTTSTRRTGTCACWPPTWCSTCRWSVSRAQGRPHHGVHRRRAPAAGRRRADRGLPRGLQGAGQALQGSLQAAALRPRRVRLGRAARPRRRSCRARSSAPRRSTR